MRILILLLVLALWPTRDADARESPRYATAHVYLYGWDERTRWRLSLDDVRRMSALTTAFRDSDDATAFAKSLRLEALASTVRTVVDEPRLVIDFVTTGGTRVTYYANDFYLFSEDGRQMREIDCAFKRRFVLLPPDDCE